MKKPLLCAMLALMLLTLLAGPSFAAGDAAVSLPISQSVSGGAEKLTVTYTLTASDPTAPMPEGATGGVYTFQLTGKTSDRLPELLPQIPGKWTYTLTAEAQDARVTPDKLTVELTAELRDGDLAVTALATLPNGEKTDLTFAVSAQGTNVPAPTSTPGTSPKPGKTPKTGDDTVLAPYYAAAACSLVVMVLLLARMRREDRENQA